MADKVYSGVFPIAPTTFDERGDLDLESQKRAIDFLIDAGVDGICILANYSEQFALTDAERDQLVDVILGAQRRAACRSSSRRATTARGSRPSAAAARRPPGRRW